MFKILFLFPLLATAKHQQQQQPSTNYDKNNSTFTFVLNALNGVW